MVRIQQPNIDIGKSHEDREDKGPASQFFQRVIVREFQPHYLFQFSSADMHPLGGYFLLILQFFQRIGTDDFMVYGKVHQPVQPTEIEIRQRCSEVLISLQVNLIFLSEFFGDVRKYAPIATIIFMMKLLIERYLECTICATFLSISLMVFMIYLFLSIILS